MGINLTEISQKVLDTVGNAANVFRKMYDLHFNPNPLNVEVEYVDENGVKRTTNIPNVAGFRKRVWDDVGGALGQFKRYVYVDQQNGDDLNDGSSSRPFATLKKAIESIPLSGYGSIEIIGQYVGNGEEIVISQKHISIILKDSMNVNVVDFDETYAKLGLVFILSKSANLEIVAATGSSGQIAINENTTGKNFQYSRKALVLYLNDAGFKSFKYKTYLSSPISPLIIKAGLLALQYNGSADRTSNHFAIMPYYGDSIKPIEIHSNAIGLLDAANGFFDIFHSSGAGIIDESGNQIATKDVYLNLRLDSSGGRLTFRANTEDVYQ